MTEAKRSYLVAYDVIDDRRRNHVSKILMTCGERVQHSVFLLEVRPSKILDVRKRIEGEIDLETDSVLICFLGIKATARRDMTFIGKRSYQDVSIPAII
ncbi:CRISPR-associated endonuclease Cas2 [Bifidobacterium phasiani]|uniref:CRISPR-associated endoribonuclease Cas2 n=1 Tax=Bifidobacterium phasiani TaxID=2834431 RepID=A0ABS6W9K6_9BIFI|nr:CRISPR-associated endonuclease Cas2 [Bifidobacterium phasiani]MBW3083112.1 CRISPR-associated endonuclease Cas2 [Bifidobacterium phasiani]